MSVSIRPINPEKDAADIAELVKTSFRPWLDRENMEYLSSLRDEGLYAERHPLLSRFSSFPYKLEGVVCRDHDGKLLGLINSYDFSLNDEPCSLLANICVHPSRRHEGIASRMLDEIEKIRRAKGTHSFFLQARLEKPAVIRFYREHGFRVTDYRETWVLPQRKDRTEPYAGGLRSGPVPRSDMRSFETLLKKAYPLSVLWNLDCRRDLFQPGIAAEIRNRIGSVSDCFRRITDPDERILAWAAYQKHSGFADTLWLIPNEGLSAAEYCSVLKYLGSDFIHGKAVRIDIAAGKYTDPLRSAGFVHMQTLAWMWKKL